MFRRRSNFDLRRLLDGETRRLLQPIINKNLIAPLEGSEPFLHNLISQLQFDFAFFTSSLQPLRMSPFLREAAASALVPPTKISVGKTALHLVYGDLIVLPFTLESTLRSLGRRQQDCHATSSTQTLDTSNGSPSIAQCALGITSVADLGNLVADLFTEV